MSSNPQHTDSSTTTLNDGPIDDVTRALPTQPAGQPAHHEYAQSAYTDPAYAAEPVATAPVSEPAAAPRSSSGGMNPKNALIAGGVGLAAAFSILGFGVGYVVGDSGSSNSSVTQQGGFPGGGMQGNTQGGMGGGMQGGTGGMQGGTQGGMGGGMQGGQMPQMGGGMPGQTQQGQTGQTQQGQTGQTQQGQTQQGQTSTGT